MLLCITHAGRTTEHSFVMDNVDLDDAYLKSLAEEVRAVKKGTFQHFMVDRVENLAGGEVRAYLRPKVPFGGVEPTSQFDILQEQLDIAVEALLQYSTSSVAGDRARDALARIAALDAPGSVQ